MKTRLLIIGIIAFVVGAAGYLVIFYDLTPSTTVNDFGISARIVHGFDDRIMCRIEPCDTSIYLMHIHSEMPGFVTGYNICKGLACIRNDELQLFVGPENDPRNQIVYLSKNVPWQVGDIVNIRLEVAGSVSVDGKNYPDTHKRLHLDLGNSIVVEQDNPYSSIGMSEKDTNKKSVEHSLTVHGLNETYSVGQKIEFIVKFDGIGHYYEYPQLRIEDGNHENIWKNSDIASLNDLDLKKERIKKEWKIGDNIYFVAPIIDKEGFYTLFVEFENEITQKNFWVKPLLQEIQFKEIKYNIEQTHYHVCNIKLEKNKIIIDLNWIFKNSPEEKEIISKIPSFVDYQIVYYDGYTDYFIGEDTANTCETLKN
jgi:hypothetical protein